MFFNQKISEGVKLLAQHMTENPDDWVQGAYHFSSVICPDIRIWTANGVSFLRLEGNDAFNQPEKRFMMAAINKSIALRLLGHNVGIKGAR